MTATRRPAADGDRDAATIVAARRVLVVPGDDCDTDTAAAACDLAEAAGAAVDGGGRDAAQAAGPTIARIGTVTADPDELRDRADLVILWFCAAASGAPDFVARFVSPPTAAGRPRRVIALGPDGMPAADHLATPTAAQVDLARLVQAAVIARPVAPPPALTAACAALHAAIDAATCVGIVTAHADDVGLAPWAVTGLVRAVAHRTPAFEVPLAADSAAAAVSTWRYGAAGAIARADRAGSAFRPAEDDARRLVERGEVDCVVTVGAVSAAVESALAAAAGRVRVVRIAGPAADAQARLAALTAAVRSAGGPA